MRKHFYLVGLVMSVLAGCASLAPKPLTAEVALPKKFNTDLQQTSEPEESTTFWWSLFDDSVLAGLVRKAQTQNLDIRTATTQIEIARALRTEARQAYLPAGGVEAEVNEFRKSALETGAQTARGDRQSVGGLAQWEIDLFGRIRSANQAALARLEASEAIAERVQHSVTAEVVRTYFEIRAAQNHLEILQEYHQAQTKVVTILKAQLALGSGRGEDLERALAELKEDEAKIAITEARVNKLQHAMAVLVNEVPGEFQIPAFDTYVPLQFKPLVAATPGAWLRRRPDIRAAEKKLQAEIADIGIVTADLFPQFSINGYFGYVAGRGDALQDTNNESWFIGPQLRWGVFDVGRVKARIRQAKRQADVSLLEFERTVLQGLAETQTAFSDLSAAQKRVATTHAQAIHSERAAQLINMRYQEGVVSFLELLDAQRSHLRARLASSDSIAGHQLATVDLFRTFGVAELAAK